MRARSFLSGIVLALVGFFVSWGVFAAPPPYGNAYVGSNESDAYSACLADKAWADAMYNNTAATCSFGGLTTLAIAPSCASNSRIGLYESNSVAGMYVFYWCVSASCSAGSVESSHAGVLSGYAYPYRTDGSGCCITFSQTGSQTFGSGTYLMGDTTRTGSYCAENYASPANASPPPSKVCDGASCYDPRTGTACYTTESGEQVCKKVGGGAAGGCAVGATGAACYNPSGSASPPASSATPPDPPVSPGKSPDQSLTGSEKDASGNVTNNYTFNSYSDTSPGSGQEGAGSQSSGYSGSNANGSGNSGANGNGPASGSSTSGAGQCPNGGSPTASGCSGTYTDGGCDVPPQCYGDAVLCGIAVNTHKTACEVASGSTAGLPPGSGDGTDNSGDPTASAVSSSVDLGDGSTLDASGFGYATSCPLTDLSFSVMGQSIDVPLSSLCNWISVIRYIVLAMAYFLAAKIIAGVK